MGNPKLRSVDVLPVQDGMYALRDPARYTNSMLLVPAVTLAIVALLDGTRSVSEAGREFARRHGQAVPESRIRDIVEKLDAEGFLEGESFERRRAKMDGEFAAAAVRPAAHAGSGYEADPGALRGELDGLFGGLPARKAGTEPPLKAIIAPHIDVRRGGSCYALAYREAGTGGEARTVVLLGISHSPMKNRYAMCEKDFATPLGTVRTDRDTARKLAGACSFDPFEEEGVHRYEHSLEFQAVFLRYALADREDLRIVPVLCGPLPAELYSHGSPMDDPHVSSFVRGLRSLCAEKGEKILLIAGADLCHVGRRFGGREEITPRFFAEARARDLEMLESVTGGDAKGFISFIQTEEDRRNVCGVPAIYALLAALGPCVRGRLLGYDMAMDPDGQSAVGFAAVAFGGDARQSPR